MKSPAALFHTTAQHGLSGRLHISTLLYSFCSFSNRQQRSQRSALPLTSSKAIRSPQRLSLGLFSCGLSHLPFHSLSFVCLLVYHASIICLCLLCCTLSLSPLGAVPCQCLRHISNCIVLCLLYLLLTCSVWCFVCKLLSVHRELHVAGREKPCCHMIIVWGGGEKFSIVCYSALSLFFVLFFLP